MRKQRGSVGAPLDFGSEPAAVADHLQPATAQEFLTGERLVPLVQVRIDGETQARVGIDEETVKKYAEAYRERGPEALKAGVLFFDGTDNWLGDGFHRYHAGGCAGLSALPFDVRTGTRRDAQLYALGPANREHGLPMSNADKRKAVGILLADPEWGTWTSRRIADHVGCSHTFVDNLRRPARAEEGAASGNECQEEEPRPRKALRGGKELVMETARRRQAPAELPDAAVLRRHEDAGQKAPPREVRPEGGEEAAARRGYRLGAAEAMLRVAGWLDLKVRQSDGPEHVEGLIEARIGELLAAAPAGPLSVACPAAWCAARVGAPCRTSDGRTRKPHVDRERAGELQAELPQQEASP